MVPPPLAEIFGETLGWRAASTFERSIDALDSDLRRCEEEDFNFGGHSDCDGGESSTEECPEAEVERRRGVSSLSDKAIACGLQSILKLQEAQPYRAAVGAVRALSLRPSEGNDRPINVLAVVECRL